MGIQASVNRGVTPLPADISFQAGHIGLLNMAAFLPGVRSLHVGTPPLQSCLQQGQLDFWATMQNDTTGVPSMMFDLSELMPRMSQPVEPFQIDQWELCELLTDPDDIASLSSDTTPPISRVGSPSCGFEEPGEYPDKSQTVSNGTFTPTLVPGTPNGTASDQETLKRVLPDTRVAERLEKRLRMGDEMEALGYQEKVAHSAGRTSESAARRKRKRTPESLERGRAESARARARRKVRYQKLRQEVQDRTKRAAALQYHLQSLQMEALQLRTLLLANFGISVLPGTVPLGGTYTGDMDQSMKQSTLRALAVRPDSEVPIAQAMTN